MTFKEPTNNYQALVLALSLAIIAPTKKDSDYAKAYSKILSKGMKSEYLERAKSESLALLKSELA